MCKKWANHLYVSLLLQLQLFAWRVKKIKNWISIRRCLQLVLSGLVYNAIAGISGNTVTINAFKATTKPMVNIDAFSYVSDNQDGKEFKFNLNTSEMLWLNQIKAAAGYSPSNTLYLLPISRFDICVDATDKAAGMGMKVQNAKFEDGSGNTIHAYVQVYGNGAASAGTQEMIFSFDDGTHPGLTSDNIKRLIIASAGALPTGSTLYSQLSTTSEFGSNAPLTSITDIVNNSNSFTKLDHFHVPSHAGYTYAKTTATYSGTQFHYDKTNFTGGCGSINAGKVSIVVFVSINDILQVPAGNYDATISLGFGE